MKEWACSLNPKYAPGMTVRVETVLERGLKILRGRNLSAAISEEDIAEKRKRVERAKQGIVTMGKM